MANVGKQLERDQVKRNIQRMIESRRQALVRKMMVGDDV